MRAPDFIIGGAADPYLERWHLLPRNRWLNVYLHHFRHSDDDRALHDHPYMWNVSILLRGRYIEHMPARTKLRKAWGAVFRWGRATHRIELIGGAPAWTLFITGPRVREWGFYCPNGWRPWHEFVDSRDSGSTGRGCD